MADEVAPHDAGNSNRPQLRKRLVTKVLEEVGLVALYHSAWDVKLLLVQRLMRVIAYGGSTLVLVAYLEALSITKIQIGLFMTLTLAGDVCISFVLTLFADGVGRKATLALSAALMATSGMVFALSDNYWVLLAAAVCGVITPSGNEIGPFRAIEDSIVAHLTAPDARGDVYAWFSLIGKAGIAMGMVLCGWAIHVMTNQLDHTLVDGYRAVFVAYAALGLMKLFLALALSSKVESEKKVNSQRPTDTTTMAPRQLTDETTPLLTNGGQYGGTANKATDASTTRGIPSFLPSISADSWPIMIKLCLLFGLNAFASGLAPMSWLTYFLQTKFGIEEGTLGTIFFATNVCSAASIIVASSLAKRFGNVNIMVFTHLPSNILMALIGVPDDVVWALVFLFLRDSTNSMIVAPRSAFLAAIVKPHERTALVGLINVVKTLAQTVGPFATGVLAERGLFWVAFLCAGIGRGLYDVALFLLFRNHERENERADILEARTGGSDEETDVRGEDEAQEGRTGVEEETGRT